MTDTVPSAEFEELAVVERNGFVESRHFGALVGLDAAGQVAVAAGDIDLRIFPRSSLKPWQAAACHSAGLRLDGPATAISAGSHTGEDGHVEVVEQILASAGLTTAALQCPPDWPEDAATRNRLIAGGVGPEPIRMNCSGKHAAMLATCVLHGWDTASYLEPDHPLQRQVRKVVADCTEGAAEPLAVDGCGTPLFGTTLRGLARAATSMVAADAGSSTRVVADAMREHPWFVGGTGHVNTELMRRVPGLLVKGGAEGVMMAAHPDGPAVALKIIDGSPRATTVIVIAALRALGLAVDADGLDQVPVLGGGRPVGGIRADGIWLTRRTADGGS